MRIHEKMIAWLGSNSNSVLMALVAEHNHKMDLVIAEIVSIIWYFLHNYEGKEVGEEAKLKAVLAALMASGGQWSVTGDTSGELWQMIVTAPNLKSATELVMRQYKGELPQDYD